MIRIFIGLLLFVSVLSIFGGGYFAGYLTTQNSLKSTKEGSDRTLQKMDNSTKKNLHKKGNIEPNNNIENITGTKIKNENIKNPTKVQGSNKPENQNKVQGVNRVNDVSVLEKSDQLGIPSDKIPLTHIGSPIVLYKIQKKIVNWQNKDGIDRKVLNSNGAKLSTTEQDAPSESISPLPKVKNKSQGYSTTSQNKKNISEAILVAELMSTTQNLRVVQPSAIYSLRIGTYTSQYIAESISHKFKTKGIDTDIYKELDERQREWFTLVVGSYPNVELASKRFRELSEKTATTPSIVLIKFLPDIKSK